MTRLISGMYLTFLASFTGKYTQNYVIWFHIAQQLIYLHTIIFQHIMSHMFMYYERLLISFCILPKLKTMMP